MFPSIHAFHSGCLNRDHSPTNRHGGLMCFPLQHRFDCVYCHPPRPATNTNQSIGLILVASVRFNPHASPRPAVSTVVVVSVTRCETWNKNSNVARFWITSVASTVVFCGCFWRLWYATILHLYRSERERERGANVLETMGWCLFNIGPYSVLPMQHTVQNPRRPRWISGCCCRWTNQFDSPPMVSYWLPVITFCRNYHAHLQ